MGKLFLVSTPIGNLEDITLRAKRILSEVDVIACEDTRKTGMLLQKLYTPDRPKLLSYYEENEPQRIPQIIKLLKEGKNVALVSNAGTPTISDPGFKLVRQCIKEGIKVKAIPGASAILTALVSSSLPTDKFLFLGYLPKKQSKRKKLLQNLFTIYRYMQITTIVFVSPHRLIKVLKNVKEIFGNIEIVLCRELTKLREEIRREKISQAITHFQKTKPRGEFTLLIHLGGGVGTTPKEI